MAPLSLSGDNRRMRTTVLLLLATLELGAATTCFLPINSSDHLAIIEKREVPTQRACEYACEQNGQCTHISIFQRETDVACSLLGKKIVSETCIVPKLIYRKTKENCPDRTNASVGFGVDACVKTTADLHIVTTTPVRICAERVDIVVRVVLEDGTRRTLDNDAESFVEYDTVKKMWTYIYRPVSAFRVDFVAGVCAATDSAKCACADLALATLPSPLVPAPVPTNTTRACGAKTVYFSWDKKPQLQMKSADKMPKIVCRAGQWLLEEKNRNYGIHVLAAACA